MTVAFIAVKLSIASIVHIYTFMVKVYPPRVHPGILFLSASTPPRDDSNDVAVSFLLSDQRTSAVTLASILSQISGAEHALGDLT